MKAFRHINATSVEEAISLLGRDRTKALPIAGGSDLLREMKERRETPEALVNLKTIPGLDTIQRKPQAISIGPLVLIADVAESSLLRTHFPVLAEAAAVIASPQIRNRGTVGGNLCQRPCCWYYRGPLHCRRKGGTECFAVPNGDNRFHAILGGSRCFMVHPSDIAPALVALQATARIAGASGERTISLEEFFVLPSVNVERENILEPDEILTEIQIPLPAPGTRSTYLKQMERDAWDYALVSVAAVLRQEDGKVQQARITMGGVAPIPWRSREVEEALVGKRLNQESARKAADRAMDQARPLPHNAYKVDLSRTVIRRALLRLA